MNHMADPWKTGDQILEKQNRDAAKRLKAARKPEERRLEDHSYGSLIRLRERIDAELRRLALDEVRQLEIQANEIRAAHGFKTRPMKKRETLLKDHAEKP